MAARDFFAQRRTRAEHALDFRADRIGLMRRDGAGWRLLAEAPLEDPDFTDRIAELRALLDEPEVELWLPPEQVLGRSLALEAATNFNRRSVAAAVLAERLDAAPEDLVVDLRPSESGLWHAMAADRTVVSEAMDYASRWSFEPVRVTAQAGLDVFEGGPDFTPQTGWRIPAPVIWGGAGALATSAAAAAFLVLLPLAGPPPAPVTDAPAALSHAAPDDASALTLDGSAGWAAPVAAPAPQPLVSRRSADFADLAEAPGAVLIEAPDQARSPAPAAAPSQQTAMSGPEMASPRAILPPLRDPHQVARGLNRSPQPLLGPLAPAPASPYGIASATQSIVAGPAEGSPAIMETARLSPGPLETPTTPVAPVGDVAEAASRVENAPPRLSDDDRDQQAVVNAYTDAAEPPRVAAASTAPPPPRPGEEPEGLGASDVADELVRDQTAAPAEAVEEAVEIASVSPAEPVIDLDTVGATDDAQEAAEDDAPGPGAVARAPAPQKRPEIDRTPSALAALTAPAPKARPGSIKPRPKAAPTVTQTATAAPAPRRPGPAGPGVTNAATVRNVMALDATSLLGVFGSSKSRRALLRMADGRIRRVSAGEVVDGWVVQRIEATSMRMTRGGETRNLALVR